jgi:hypothetical protein
MPKEEPQRTAEAVRRALPSLLRLQRYEARAAARRDQAIRELAFFTKRTQFSVLRSEGYIRNLSEPTPDHLSSPS